MGTGPDGQEFTVITFNEKTKKNQGDSTPSKADKLHNNRHNITEQNGNILCPVKSFKMYSDLSSDTQNQAFFQYPNKEKDATLMHLWGKIHSAT